jgi:hypothetical protein
MNKHKHRRSAPADESPQAAGIPPTQDEAAAAGFAGPGYSGFGGSAGYNGSGAGGINGGYAGGGYFGAYSWTAPAETRHDDRIHDDVKDRLAMNNEVDASQIEVLVAAGEVTLQGNVETRHMKQIARDIAAAVPGVATVHNRLHVEQSLLDELREKLAPERAPRTR